MTSTKPEFPSVITVMSLASLGSASTEYGCAAKELTEEDLSDYDSYGEGFNQEELTEDIRANGVTEPIEVVYDAEEEPWNRFSIVNGHHRYIAARNAGLTKVPVKITAGSLLRGDSVNGFYAVTGRLPELDEIQ
jgi:hypothetical protein